MTYTLTTFIAGQPVTVQCDERSARILLRTWAEREDRTTCRDDATGDSIVCFIPDESTSWGRWARQYRHIANGADEARPRWPGGTFRDRIVQGLMDDEGFRQKAAGEVADWFVYGIEPVDA